MKCLLHVVNLWPIRTFRVLKGLKIVFGINAKRCFHKLQLKVIKAAISHRLCLCWDIWCWPRLEEGQTISIPKIRGDWRCFPSRICLTLSATNDKNSFLSEKVGVDGVWMDGMLEGKSSSLKGGFLPNRWCFVQRRNLENSGCTVTARENSAQVTNVSQCDLVREGMAG